MKHCPSCEFTFPDFHHVCDFDGTELIPDSERPLLATSTHRSRLRRCLKSPFFLAVLSAMALLSSALLIGYYDSLNESTSPASVAKPNTPQPTPSIALVPTSSKSSVTIDPGVNQRRNKVRFLSRSLKRSNGRLRPKTIAQRSPARTDQKASIESPLRRSHMAARRDTKQVSTVRTQTAGASDRQQTSRDSGPKFTAIVKQTWRVLTKPFKF